MTKTERVIAPRAVVSGESIGGARLGKVRIDAPAAHCGWHRSTWIQYGTIGNRQPPEVGTEGHLLYVTHRDGNGVVQRGSIEFREGTAPGPCQCMHCRKAEVLV